VDSILVGLETQKVAFEREIRRIQRKIFEHITRIQGDDAEILVPWYRILAVAHGTGLDHETIRRSFNCSVPTYQYWCEGKASPSPPLRARLIEVLRSEMDRVDD